MINKKNILIIVVILIIIITYGTKKIIKSEEIFDETDLEQIVVNSELPETLNTTIIEKIKIHIVGEVNNPGLIELNNGSRVQDAIELAGGLTDFADTSKTNLAHILSDGEKIKIPSQNDEENEYIESNFSEKININTATVQELKTIPGVGEATANSIIEYRTKIGRFMSIEDIKNVSGIGQSKFEKMKDYITVK